MVQHIIEGFGSLHFLSGQERINLALRLHAEALNMITRLRRDHGQEASDRLAAALRAHSVIHPLIEDLADFAEGLGTSVLIDPKQTIN